jgi:arylsulfatase A-like enzyme
VNVLFVSVDSLRRDFLTTYAEQPAVVDYDVDTDNLDRFAERATVFDTHYAGSLPCMPARREWLTGTKEFLWRPWGPTEPFDAHIAEVARDEGILTKLITDHFHYFQHGSHGYYEDFNGFDFVRGNEYDAWKTAPLDPGRKRTDRFLDRRTDPPESVQYLNRTAYARNSFDFDSEADYFTSKVFSRAVDWLDANQEWDQWFCYIDNFDVHEPFDVPEPYASMYTDEDPDDPELPLWPYYGPVDEGQSELTDRELRFVRSQFAGNVTMVDRWLGELFDSLDANDLWDETMVVVTSDHGFALGDHGYIGKNDFLPYDVIARTPLLVWHPEGTAERVSALTTAVDLYATLLDGMNIADAPTRHSRSLEPLITDRREKHREFALYGYWGSSVNVTDGTFTYHHPPRADSETECHSTHMINPNSWFTPPEPRPDAESGRFVPYAETPVWRYNAGSWLQHEDTRLYDTTEDPRQQHDRVEEDRETAERMRDGLRERLNALDAPSSQTTRLGVQR